MNGVLTQLQLQERENLNLAPWAVQSRNSLGRKNAEAPHPFRTEFQRDRARVIHCSAFRRLDGKTQVFLNGTGDHFRTRLTHTIEVASVSRTIARALSLNEDLAEAVALAHDLGHSPFGHAGEKTLHELMRAYGGFDHNEQSLRIVETLEEKYPGVCGLNLSFEVVEGLRKHQSSWTLPDGSSVRQTSLEGQIADLADEITYCSHDLDDGLESGLLTWDQLSELDLWREAVAEASARRGFDPVKHRGFVIRSLINRQVENVVHSSARKISRAGIRDVSDVRRLNRRLIDFDPTLQKKHRQLRKFLYRNLYFHPAVADVHHRFCGILREAFLLLCSRPELLGAKASARLRSEGVERTVCDYLSGMTDRYLIRSVKVWNSNSYGTG
jgi:dGTPase